MNKKRLRFAAEIKATTDGEIEGYGSVFDVVDSYSDIVVKGAFEDSIKNDRMPAMLWQHDPSEPIGVWTSIKEDSRGLFLKGKLADTQRGREAKTLIEMGALSGLSIGYETEEYSVDAKTGVRSLLAVKLWEVSPVTFPANDAARLTGIKSVRDFEQFLRENGFSRGAAEAIATHGFKATQGEPAAELDATQGEPADGQLLEALKSCRIFR